MNLFYRIKIKSKGSRCVVNFKGKILKSWHPVEVICKWFVHVFGRLAEDITVFGQCYIVIYMVDEVSTTVKIHQVGLLSKSATKKSHLVEFYCIFCRLCFKKTDKIWPHKNQNHRFLQTHNECHTTTKKVVLTQNRAYRKSVWISATWAKWQFCFLHKLYRLFPKCALSTSSHLALNASSSWAIQGQICRERGEWNSWCPQSRLWHCLKSLLGVTSLSILSRRIDTWKTSSG